MSELITREIEKIREDYPRLSHLQDEYVFSLLCFKYFFNNGQLEYKDYYDCFVDGKSDGGIDLITVDESDEQVRLVLIQSKLISKLGNTQDIIDVFTKMDQTFRNFQDYRYARYNPRLKRIFKDKLSLVEDQMPAYDLVLFVSVALSDNQKAKIRGAIDNIEELAMYQVRTFYLEEIEGQIRNVNEPKFFVDEDRVKFANKDGWIEYGDNGILVSVSANSIKSLYDRYRERGLFEQNFRYFVRNKRIDNSINTSLREKRDKFWFLNNGIIIGCKDFRIDGNEIKLFEFSIINGCQTAVLIGLYKGENEGKDFLLPCKIVKPIDESQFEPFISDIAEASNSQKPILDRDLKANSFEQRRLQSELQQEEPKIYLEIKRGVQLVTRAKKKQLKDWQYLKNDFYGQIILSFHLQSPCTARSSKRKIFSVSNVYDKVFKRKIDKENVIDVLKLNTFYTEYSNERNEFFKPDQESVATNGRFIFLAITGFIIKMKRGLIDLKKMKNETDWELEIKKDNLEGGIFADIQIDELERRLYGFFNDMIIEVEDIYNTRSEEELTVSNFFKKDGNYRNVILRRLVDRYYVQPGSLRAKDLRYYLEMFK